MGDADPCIHQPQIIINLRDGSNCAPRPTDTSLLVYRQRGSQTINGIHIRSRDLIEVLPSVGRKAVNVLTLTFGVQRIESKRTLPAARHARNDCQGIPRNVQANTF